MKSPPVGLDSDRVLAAVREHWQPAADAVAYLPLGFGAHHWVVEVGGAADLFVTLDAYGPRHSSASLTAAYAGAAALARELDFVHASLAPYVVPFARGALSVTPWLVGERPEELEVDATTALLDRLHATTPPDGLPRWRPLVPPSFADDLISRLATTWHRGPHGDAAHQMLTAHLGEVKTWTADYHRLALQAADRPWVVTHGEPHQHNQLRTDAGLRLVDWESLKLAPAERDLDGLGCGDAAMLHMFDLEWRLDEISQYAAWFRHEHGDSPDDRAALGGLEEELSRPDRRAPT